jgi:hypothetical protein
MKQLLEEIDEMLASMESVSHGSEGRAITEMRGKIQAELKLKWEPEEDLKEIAHWYGGYDELKATVNKLEENDNEYRAERAMNEPGAWEGGFADNH